MNTNYKNLANALDDITLKLSLLDSTNTKDTLVTAEKVLKHVDQLAQTLEIPSLRALCHWMLLNTEQYDKNIVAIKELTASGSYFNWIEILSSQLQSEEYSLFQDLYDSLNTPSWYIKPSSLLLNDLIKWLEKATNKQANIPQISTLTTSNEKTLVESLNNSDTASYPETVEEVAVTEKRASAYEEIQAVNTLAVTPSPVPTSTQQNEDTPVKSDVGAIPKEIKYSKLSENECFGLLSVELDEVIMSLISLNNTSEDILQESDALNNKLEHLIIFATKCSYPNIVQVTRWCQRNIDLFSRNKSHLLYRFVESGECWAWLELLGYCLNETDGLSNLALLRTELSREEWIEPIEVEDLQNLLLFLKISKEQNIKTTAKTESKFETHEEMINESEFCNLSNLSNDISNDINNEKTLKSSDTSSAIAQEEETTLSFTWDEDIHPELLSAYFEETPDLVEELALFLYKISKKQTSKEEHQHASRLAHTIKGGSAVLGITALAEYAHKLEDILDYAVKNDLPQGTSDYLPTASACLEELFHAVQNQQVAPQEFPQVLRMLDQYAKQLAANAPAEDNLLELSSAPALPDFIQQSNNNEVNSQVEPDSNNTRFKTNDSIKNTEAEKDSLTEVTPSVASQSIEPEEPVAEPSSEELNQKSIQELEPNLELSVDINDFTAEVDDIVMTLSTLYMEPENSFPNLAAAQEELQRLDLLSEISGYAEISNISQWCQNNLTVFEKEKTETSKAFIMSGECWTWIELIGASLADPEEKSFLSLLSQELSRDEWLQPIERQDLQTILLLLNGTKPEQSLQTQESKSLDIIKTETGAGNNKVDSIQNGDNSDNSDNSNQTPETVEKTPETTSHSKYTLRWDDDIHPELLSVYLQETPEQIIEAAQLIHKITKNEASKEDHQHAARIVHTIKGASGVVGITALAEYTHKLEDILDYSVTHKLPTEASALLTESADCLEDLFDAIISKGKEPKEFSPILLKLTQYADNLESIDESEDTGDVELTMPELPDFIKAQGTNVVNSQTNNVEKTADSGNTALSQESSIKEDNDTPATETHIKVPIAVIDKLLNLAGELVTATTQISDKIQNSLATNKQIKTQDERVHNMLNELSLTISKQEKNQMSMLSSLKDSNFDSLEMDTYNELHSVAGLLTESILDSEEIDSYLGQQLNELTEYTRSLSQLNKELSETILNSRMVSINALIPRLERIIRQTSRKTGKKVELAVSGNSINIDTDILNKLTDPLLHLLRNSIDHGIESPEERKINGKYATGRISLKFARKGKHIHMELKDDGAGIDPDKIYHHALKMGFIKPDDEYSENEIFQLILQPGLSTQDKVTDISGRGVGMDVVANAVKLLNGKLEISSKKGKGTTFTIKVPLTLVTSGTVLVEISGSQVAIPVDAIEQLFYLAPNKVIEKDGTQYIQYNENKLPIISLASLLDWPVTKPDFSITNTLLIIKGKNEIHAVYIDKIIHSREVVIKSLAPWINSDKGLIGACHLVDGSVAAVINPSQLLALTETDEEMKIKYQVTLLEPENIVNTTPQILVVDDSLSNRKALSLIIDQTEYDVLTAVDGLDALQVMNDNPIDVVFTDLEMPRMNGLELTQSIRAWDANKHTPVVMITSRTTSKHQQLAVKAGVNQYLTKPVIAETLIASIEHWLQVISRPKVTV